jgi:hypothetical protein
VSDQESAQRALAEGLARSRDDVRLDSRGYLVDPINGLDTAAPRHDDAPLRSRNLRALRQGERRDPYREPGHPLALRSDDE